MPGLETATTGPQPTGPGADLPQGASLGRYVVLKRLGRGGMGVVYLGFDNELERRVAIKVLRADSERGASVPESRSRLVREAQAMAKVSHPNVVAVYEVGAFGDGVFLAMEYVPGATLREWRDRAERSAREVVLAYLQAGRGLEAAHAEGLLHRDFKPENVLVDERGRVRVLDFGLARLAGGGAADRDAAPADTSSVALEQTAVAHRGGLETPFTAVGAVVGTPAYMAPEQLLGEPVTARTDQFSFCLSLYEALFGQRPFGGATVGERADAMRAGRFEPVPKELAVSGMRRVAGVRHVLARGLSGAQEARYESMGALLTALEQAIAAPTRWGAGVAVTAAIVATAAIALARPLGGNVCRGAAQAIAPSWSDARAADVARAFRASGNPRADEAIAHVGPPLDRYAASWVAAHTDACEATRVRGEQSDEGLDLRMACLGQRASELRATVDLLARADEATVDNAVLAVSRLTPVKSCLDVAALRAPFARPRDEAQRAAVEVVRSQLASVQAGEHAGQWTDAYRAVAPLVDQAERTGYAPLRSQVLMAKGDAEYSLELPATSETYFAAALEAEASHDDALSARAWTALAKYHGAVKEDFADAARFLRVADAAVRRAGGDDLLRADLLAARGWIAYRQGVASDARRYSEEALAIRSRVLGPDDPETLTSRSDVADRLYDEGEIEASLAMDEQIYEARVRTLGETHSSTVRTLGDMVQAHAEIGDYAKGVELGRRSMTLASTPLRKGLMRMYCAEALVGAGSVEEGSALFGEGMETLRALRGAESEIVAGEYAQFSEVLSDRGMDREAEEDADRALAVLTKLERGEARHGAFGVRALSRARRGNAAGALADAEAALALPGATRFDVKPLLARGEALMMLHREPEAVADLERALAIADGAKGDAALRADARFALARALVATGGDRGRAVTLGAQAAEELERAGMGGEAREARGWVEDSKRR